MTSFQLQKISIFKKILRKQQTQDFPEVNLSTNEI